MASRKLLYLLGIWTIVEGPGVPETAKGRKKALAEFSVFSVPQKRRRDTILTILGGHFEAHSCIVFCEKACSFPGVFFLQFCDVFGEGPAAGGRPILLKILHISSQFDHAVNP